jgi:hypothetical protein
MSDAGQRRGLAADRTCHGRGPQRRKPRQQTRHSAPYTPHGRGLSLRTRSLSPGTGFGSGAEHGEEKRRPSEPGIIQTVTASDVLEIRSSEAAASLAIRRDDVRGPHSELNDGYWNARLLCGPLEASLRFYEMGLGDLSGYFAALAADWRGWEGERRWESLEGDLGLIAAHDGLGTVTLTARLRTAPFSTHRWDASAELMLDAGGLDRLARQAELLAQPC